MARKYLLAQGRSGKSPAGLGALAVQRLVADSLVLAGTYQGAIHLTKQVAHGYGTMVSTRALAWLRCMGQSAPCHILCLENPCEDQESQWVGSSLFLEAEDCFKPGQYPQAKQGHESVDSDRAIEIFLRVARTNQMALAMQSNHGQNRTALEYDSVMADVFVLE